MSNSAVSFKVKIKGGKWLLFSATIVKFMDYSTCFIDDVESLLFLFIYYKKWVKANEIDKLMSIENICTKDNGL